LRIPLKEGRASERRPKDRVKRAFFWENFNISTIYLITVEAAKVHYGIQVHPMTIVAKHIPNNGLAD
jgi:hypothetical protein